jgi:hypothetical protein
LNGDVIAYLSVLLFLSSHTPAASARATAPLPSLRACVAVTQRDVESALQRPVGKGTEEGGGLESNCDYSSDNSIVSVRLQHLTQHLDISAELAALRQSLPTASVSEADGVGTRAFFLDIAGAGTQLHVVRGERDYLMVSVLGFGEPADVRAAAVALARTALDRF